MSFDVGAIRQIGKYPVERFLAEGGMAWVFRVTDPDLFNAPRALKLLKPQAAEGDDYQRFLAEAQILATIQHPNLIHVYDFGQDAETGCHYYTMDYIEGNTLEDVPTDWFEPEDEDEEEEEVAREAEAVVADPNATSFIHVQQPTVKSRTTVRDVCEYFSGVLAALARLHRENVVHRDIKPENIFLTHDGIAVLGDLGIATGRHSSGISEVGRVPGTPLYMSPEHAMGQTTGVRADVFSLGLSIYAVLSGETVYHQIEDVDAADSQAVLNHLLALAANGEEFEFIFHDSIPDEVCEVIEKACHIDQADRYASADEFNEALRGAVDGVSQGAPGGIRPMVAAAIAVPIVALIGYFGLQAVLNGDKAVAAEESAVQTSALERTARSLIANVSGLESGPAEEVIAAANASFEKAKKNAATGRTNLNDSDYDSAQQMFVRARSGYDSMCRDLTSKFLAQAAPPHVKEARMAREQVEPAAEQIVPRDWQELNTLTAKLDIPLAPGGCARADGLWAHVDVSARVISKAKDVGTEMNRRMPEVSAAAIASAEEARQSARAFQSDDPEYAPLLGLATSSLDRGKLAARGGKHSEAARLARRAKADFDSAAAVRPAALARNDATTARQDAEGWGVPARMLSEGENMFSEGLVKFRGGEFAAAEELFREAMNGFRDGKRQAVDEGLIDPNATNVKALELAKSRAEDAERQRIAEDERRVTERAAAEASELAAQKELEELRQALANAKSAPTPQQLAAIVPPEEAAVQKAMKEYETAYESRSIDDLNRVWSMSRFERLQVQRLFDDCGEIRVQIGIGDSNVQGSTARVDYDETIVFKQCETTKSGSRYSELSASLAKRGDNWQIKTIRAR